MAFCGKCGSQLHDNATFCANCGSPIGAAAAPPQHAGGVPVTPPTYVPQPVYVPAPPPPPHDSFGSLFDVTFKGSAGMPLVRVLFVVTIILAVAAVGFIIYVSQNERTIDPTLALIVIPIVAFLYIMQSRLVMEVCAAVFRMEKHLAEIIQQGRR